MFACNLTKQEIIDRIVIEHERLSTFARNTRDPDFAAFEKARADYLKSLMIDVLEFTEEED